MSAEVLYRDELVTLLLGDSTELGLDGDILITDPPMDLDLGHVFRGGMAVHLIVHPHILWRYFSRPPLHVSAWIRHTPGLVRDGFGHHWNAVLHYGPADLATDVFWDDEPRVTDHPAERGVAPLRDLIAALPPGDILDPFCGSGSVLLAARACGRRAVGVEINPEFAEMARSRLAA